MKNIEVLVRKEFNKVVLNATYKAQKKYGFKIGSGEHATWNNEADAFKHAYMSWFLSWYQGDKVSKKLGDLHEKETPNAPDSERNMDLWNNAIGRKIAYEMKWRVGDDYELLGDEWASETASRMIWEKMQQGELITDPYNDKRKFENMEFERLKESDKVFSQDEFKNFDEKMKSLRMNSYMDYVINNDWEVPSKSNLDKHVQSGNLIFSILIRLALENAHT